MDPNPIAAVSVSLGSHSKHHRISNLFSHGLMDNVHLLPSPFSVTSCGYFRSSPRSRCWQVCFLLRPLPLAGRWLPCLLMVIPWNECYLCSNLFLERHQSHWVKARPRGLILTNLKALSPNSLGKVNVFIDRLMRSSWSANDCRCHRNSHYISVQQPVPANLTCIHTPHGQLQTPEPSP